MRQLTFEEFDRALQARTEEDFNCHDWTLADWMTATVGEVGELANMLKKVKRGDMSFENPDDCVRIGKEFGDIAAYLFIMARKAGYDLADVSADKFNEVSVRRGSEIFL